MRVALGYQRIRSSVCVVLMEVDAQCLMVVMVTVMVMVRSPTGMISLEGFNKVPDFIYSSHSVTKFPIQAAPFEVSISNTFVNPG